MPSTRRQSFVQFLRAYADFIVPIALFAGFMWLASAESGWCCSGGRTVPFFERVLAMFIGTFLFSPIGLMFGGIVRFLRWAMFESHEEKPVAYPVFPDEPAELDAARDDES